MVLFAQAMLVLKRKKWPQGRGGRLLGQWHLFQMSRERKEGACSGGGACSAFYGSLFFHITLEEFVVSFIQIRCKFYSESLNRALSVNCKSMEC